MLEKELIKKLNSLNSIAKSSDINFNSNKEKFLNYVKKEFSNNENIIEQKVVEINEKKTKILTLDNKFNLLQFLSSKLKFGNLAIGTSAVLFVIGGFTISASAGALPGDPLYSIKLSMEKVQIAFAIQDEDNIKLQIEFTGKRIDELSKVVESNKGNKGKLASDLVNTINSNLSNIPSKVASLDKKEKIETATKEIDDKINEYDDKLKGMKKSVEDSGLKNLEQEISSIGINGNHVSVKNLNIVVQNIDLSNADESTKKDIVSRVERKVDNIKEIMISDQNNASLKSTELNTLNTEDPINPSNNTENINGEGGEGSNMVQQLDDMKSELNKMKVGLASTDGVADVLKAIDKGLDDASNNKKLQIVNPNEKLNSAIDLNKKDTNNSESLNNNSGNDIIINPDVRAEGMAGVGYGNDIHDVELDNVLWNPIEE